MIKLLILLIIGSWLILGSLFLGYPTIQRLKDEDHDFGWIVKVPIYFGLIVGLLADIVFNAVWGTIIFRELPQWHKRELLFTSRLKRHWYRGTPENRARAKPWVKRLNAIDPGHV